MLKILINKKQIKTNIELFNSRRSTLKPTMKQIKEYFDLVNRGKKSKGSDYKVNTLL